jgi:hypothetical protein
MLPVFSANLVGLLQIVLVVVLPLLTALLVKASFNKGLKAAVLALLSGVSSVLTNWLAAVTVHNVFDWRTVVLNAFIVWALAVATYYGLWKGTSTHVNLLNTGVKD